jgi:hypothetical protein
MSAAAVEPLPAEAASCAAECCRISPAAKTPGTQVRIQMSVTPPAKHTAATRSQPDERTLMRGFHDTSQAADDIVHHYYSTSMLIHRIAGEAEPARDGYVSGGTRRNLDWVAPHTRWGGDVDESERLLLADAQTSGGLLIAGSVPCGVAIGELIANAGLTLVVG